MALVKAPDNCPDCGTLPGYTHDEGCDVERCSNCGLQRIGCECQNHDPTLSFWTGYWPGDETTRLLHMDHNQLATMLAVSFPSRDRQRQP